MRCDRGSAPRGDSRLRPRARNLVPNRAGKTVTLRVTEREARGSLGEMRCDIALPHTQSDRVLPAVVVRRVVCT